MGYNKINFLSLKSRQLEDSHRIVCLLSSDFGKIKVIIKGAVKPKSRFHGGAEPFVLSEGIIYRKKEGSLAILTQFEVKDNFIGIKNNLLNNSYIFYLVDFIDNLLPENYAVYNLFEDTVWFIKKINKYNISNVVKLIELYYLFRLGYLPAMSYCNNCGGSIDYGHFSLKNHSFSCSKCIAADNKNIFIGKGTLKTILYIVNHFRKNDINRSLIKICYNKKTKDNLDDFIIKYTQHIIEKKIKSYSFLKELEKN